MNFATELVADDKYGKIEYARSGSHEEGDSLKEIWRFTHTDKVSIVVAQDGYQTHYFSSDSKTEERGRSYNGWAMTAMVKDR